MTRPSFSDTWYQVSGLKLGILPTVRVHKQRYRDQVWYVLQDSCSEKYFRVHQAAYEFLAQLDPRKTVETVWLDFCHSHPEEAPTQGEVMALLSQLHQNNLLFFRSPGEYQGIFERHRKVKRREKLTHLLAFLYFRIPVWNPDRLLKANIGWLRHFFSIPAFTVWVIAVFLGARAVLGNVPLFLDQTQGVLAADNLIWLFLAMFLLKFFHEMGHAVVCRKYGGSVHTIGIMFIALMPLPYTDASASWSLRNKWQRSMVAAAGMYVELFFAALAAVVWTQTAPGVINSLAFNIMLIGSISSLLFNGNPLLKFDSYYILSDALDLPNLYQKASQQWFYLANVYLLGTVNAVSPAENRYERNWFLLYGAASFTYRLFVMVVIMIYMADISIMLGVLMIFAMAYIWVLGPGYKLLRYLQQSPELHKNRMRAMSAVSFSIAGLLVALSVIPVPHGMRAPGVIESVQKTPLFADAGGRLMRLHVHSGDQVIAGEPILEFTNPELELEYELIGQQLIEVRWLIRRATDQAQADLAALAEREKSLLARLDDLGMRLERLQVLAPHSGVWVSALAKDRLDTEFARGESLGDVLGRDRMRFVGVVSQENASGLFSESFSSVRIRIRGHSGSGMHAEEVQFIPYQRHELPSAALAISHGGQIHAAQDSQGRTIASEPFFEIRALLPNEAAQDLHDGALGYIKVQLSSMPPLQQLTLHVRQILQSRYRL